MIDQLSLSNFKAFRHADIPLGRLTLLTGLNSSGKSTVLQAIAVVKQSVNALRSGGLLLNGALIELGTGRDVLHADWADIAGIEEEHIRIALRSGDRRASWLVGYAASADLLPEHATTTSNIGSPDEAIDVFPFLARHRAFQYLRADRVSPATTYTRSHESAIAQEFLGPHGQHTVNFLRHHQDRVDIPDPLRHPSARSATLLSQVEAWLGEISPGVNLDATGIDGTDLVRLSYGFGGRAGISASDRRRPTNVGFGLTYTLPIVVACLTARPGSLLLLENPEAHLHPRGQTRVAHLLAHAAAAGAQLLVETHSDHILNGLRLAVKDQMLPAEDVQLHYFRQSDTHGVELSSPVIGPDGMLSEWPEGFFDEWDHSVTKLLS